ncbi:MAG: porin, partial [Acidobacteria bacterium]|nr:porin [Acidobacteriota bacterium]
MKTTRYGCACAVAAIVIAAWPATSSAQWVIESKDQKTNIKIGFLIQPQLETLETADQAGTSTNIFLRRFRILFGGKVADRWTYFFETDSPNIGKATGTTGVKEAGSIYVQDAFVTYNQGDAFKVDVGMMLLAQSHNHIQSAASLLPVDYGAYTFAEATALQTRVGRDYGVQLRGYPFKQHVEYRLGVFGGVRGTDSRNALRVAGRGVWYPFAADTGYFYTGTFQGSKRVVAIGGSFDTQNAYSTYG